MNEKASKLPYPNNLQKLRKSKGLTQQDIATIWGTERADVSRIENGHVGISLEKMKKLTNNYGWTASQILEKDAGKSQNSNEDKVENNRETYAIVGELI